MAETLAVIGLVSAIVQFVDFGSKVVERLREFELAAQEVPKTFQAINVQLPLLIDTLSRNQQQATTGSLSDATIRALKPTVDACLTEVKLLQKVLDKALPPQKSSSWQRRLHALKSLARDKDVERITSTLERHIHLLTFHQSTSSSEIGDKLIAIEAARQVRDAVPEPIQSRKPIFMVPFDLDETFIGRNDIIDDVQQRLGASRRRAVLSGIGGVG